MDEELLNSYNVRRENLDFLHYTWGYCWHKRRESFEHPGDMLKSVKRHCRPLKENFLKNINPAIELGVMRMTLPDKPNSKNQRYVKQ